MVGALHMRVPWVTSLHNHGRGLSDGVGVLCSKPGEGRYEMVSMKKMPNLERNWIWHVASAKAAHIEVHMPQKTEMPMSRSASCARAR